MRAMQSQHPGGAARLSTVLAQYVNLSRCRNTAAWGTMSPNSPGRRPRKENDGRTLICCDLEETSIVVQSLDEENFEFHELLAFLWNDTAILHVMNPPMAGLAQLFPHIVRVLGRNGWQRGVSLEMWKETHGKVRRGKTSDSTVNRWVFPKYGGTPKMDGL